MGGGLGDIQDGFEGNLSFCGKMGPSQGLLTVLGDGFVKLVVLIIAYIISSTNKRTVNILTNGQSIKSTSFLFHPPSQEFINVLIVLTPGFY